jgi:hypothetical protein
MKPTGAFRTPRNMDEANSDNEHLRIELDAAQSQLKEKQSQGEELTAELESAKQAADQERARSQS